MDETRSMTSFLFRDCGSYLYSICKQIDASVSSARLLSSSVRARQTRLDWVVSPQMYPRPCYLFSQSNVGFIQSSSVKDTFLSRNPAHCDLTQSAEDRLRIECDSTLFTLAVPLCSPAGGNRFIFTVRRSQKGSAHSKIK